MNLFKRFFQVKPRIPHRRAVSDETRFLRLYSLWHETHDETLRRRLMARFQLLLRRVPNFDLRRRFEDAFQAADPMNPNVLMIRLQDEGQMRAEIKRKEDEFLDLFSLYQRTGLSWIKEELLVKAYELHVLNPKFRFHI